jgi:hypothetical protein
MKDPAQYLFMIFQARWIGSGMMWHIHNVALELPPCTEREKIFALLNSKQAPIAYRTEVKRILKTMFLT